MQSGAIRQLEPGGTWLELVVPEMLDRPAQDEAHVWASTGAGVSRPALADYIGVLSNEERCRASRFVHDRHRSEYVMAHATLRVLLGRYLGCGPADVALSKSPQGKPRCEHDRNLSFNMAHADGAVVVAIAAGHDVGVDLERIHPVSDVVSLVRRQFSSIEADAFLALPEEERDCAFCRLWTRKEAYVKALGRGLSYPLDSFEVTFGRDEPFRVGRAEPGPWSFFHLEPWRGFVGALAVRGNVVRLAGGIVAIPAPIIWP
jgi:4'-phosphopantetheinyl transferase